MAGFGFLVICILIGYAWLTRRRVMDLEEMVQTLSSHSAELFRRVSSLEKNGPQTAPDPVVTAAVPPPALAPPPVAPVAARVSAPAPQAAPPPVPPKPAMPPEPPMP